jgi:hypothetical protein
MRVKPAQAGKQETTGHFPSPDSNDLASASFREQRQAFDQSPFVGAPLQAAVNKKPPARALRAA